MFVKVKRLINAVVLKNQSLAGNQALYSSNGKLIPTDQEGTWRTRITFRV